VLAEKQRLLGEEFDVGDETWISHRKVLHERYSQVARIGDASRLAYLHGPPVVWSEEEVARLWQRAVRHPIGSTESLNCVYIHVPFCKSICNFCNYDRLQPSSPELLKNWLGRALRTIEVIGPILKPLTFHALYMGGGTPSVLPARLLHELLEAVDGMLQWHPAASRKLEFDPAVMTRERLEVLAAHKFDRLSFGIETLDPEINARHNRGRQGVELIEKSFVDLKAVGIDDVACDFLLGLEGTTPEGILDEMETVLRRFRPGWVDIFMLTPTQAYIDKHFGGSHETCWAHLGRFEQTVPAALPGLAERTGYEVRMGQGHHMKLKRIDPVKPTGMSHNVQSQYAYTALTNEARRPLNVFGLGRSARSNIFGVAAFASRDPKDSPWEQGAADYEGNAIDVADEARTFLVHHLRDNDTIDRAEFSGIFGGDVAEVIPRALAGWESEGTAQLDGAVLRFVPQDRRARTHSLLWLVPEESIEFDLAHFDQLELSSRGIQGLTASLKPGLELSGGHTFQGSDGTRVLLRTPEGDTLRLRVAPALSDEAPLRLVLETAPRARDTEPLRRAVAQLRSVLTRRHREMVSPTTGGASAHT
jgi:coproporphyrinogen III oxidase-like Fe-S oxidoreductase